VGAHDGFCYRTMTLAGGGTLVQRMAEYAADPKSAARLVATVARAIHHAHQRGILHRDLKPSNILLDEDGKPLVSDFGLAKRVDGGTDLTQSGAIVGTPSYMAPEQTSGTKGTVTTATDVYGLGTLLYALLTGRPPFQADSAIETLEQVRVREPEPPSGINRRVDRDLQTICLKCLEKEPERRYASALAVAEDLERWIAGEPTVARPLSRLARFGRWAWRRRRRLVTATALLLALSLIGVSAWQAVDLRKARQLARQQEEAIQEREEAGRQAREIRRAAVFIATGDRASARETLEYVRRTGSTPDPRGFEWDYLMGLTHAERASWVGHEGREVYHVEYAPDGRTFATAGGDGTARIWDADTEHGRLVLRGHQGDVNWVSFDADGKRLVTAGEDGTVRLWDASDGRMLKALEGRSGEVVAALFTPDGRDVIGATRDCLVVRWEIETGRRRAERRHDRRYVVESLAISSQGATLALTVRREGGHLLVLHDLRDGHLAVANVLSPGGRGFCVTFAPDGHTLAVTGPPTGADALILDVATGRLEATLEGSANTAYSLAFAPDGRSLAAADDLGALRLWDLQTQTCRASMPGHTDRIWGVAFAPDGRTVATTSRDGTIRLWDHSARPGRVVFRGLAREGHWREASSLAFAHGGARIVAANRAGDVLNCDLASGTSHVLRTADPASWGFDPMLALNGTALAAAGPRLADGTIDSLILHDLVGNRKPVVLPDAGSLCWSRDGNRIAVVDRSDYLTLWNREGRALGRIPVVASSQYRARPAFTPAGDAVIAVSGNMRTRGDPYEFIIWEPSTPHIARHRIPEGQAHPDGKIVVSPDGRRLADTRRLWDLFPLRLRFDFVGHVGSVNDVAFAPEGRTVATAGLDHTVRLWSVATAQELLKLEGHSGPVRAVAFAPDGRALASAGDGPGGGIEVIVWRAEGSARRTAQPSPPRTP
jgi:WD40 repeat protein